jgi:hypothetical protein
MVKKLKRDLVITLTDKGEKVGVYFEGEDGKNICFELNPREADTLIEIWNKLVEKYQKPRSAC